MSEASPATSGAMPDSGATPDTGDDDGTTSAAEIGDAGRRAINDLRRELRTREKALADATRRAEASEQRVREYEDGERSTLERAEASAAEWKLKFEDSEARHAQRDLDDARREAATSAGIPEMWRRLQGATPDELAEDAKQLAESINGSQPAPDYGAGARTSGPSTSMSDRIRATRRR